MNIPVNIFMWLLACLPIIVLLVLMIKFQWGATDAAPIGLAITIFTGIVFYKADLKVIVSEASKGIWLLSGRRFFFIRSVMRRGRFS